MEWSGVALWHVLLSSTWFWLAGGLFQCRELCAPRRISSTKEPLLLVSAYVPIPDSNRQSL